MRYFNIPLGQVDMSPFSGISQMNEIQKQDLLNQNQAVANQYQPQNLQAALAHALLMNTNQQIQNKFLPAQDIAGIGLTNAQAGLANAKIPLTQAQTGLTSAQIPLTQAQAQQARVMTQLLPGNQLIAAQNAIAKLYGSTMLPFARLAQTVPGEAAINKDPQLAQALVNQMRVGGAANLLPQFAQQFGAQQVNPNQQQLPAQSGNYSPINYGQQGNPIGAQLGQPQPNDVLSAIQDAAGSNVIAKTQTQQQRNQRLFANTFNNILAKVAPNLPDVLKFAGAAGQAHMTAEQYANAIGGTASPEYKAYNNFVSNQGPLLANEILRQLAGHMTDQQKDEVKALAQPDFWKKNSDVAASEMISLISTLKAADQALVQSPVQTQTTLQQSLSEPSPTEQDIRYGKGKQAPQGLTTITSAEGRTHNLSPKARAALARIMAQKGGQ